MMKEQTDLMEVAMECVMVGPGQVNDVIAFGV
jgi:hypothetical protein